MQKYSCSYGGVNENFVILNLESVSDKNTHIKEYGIFCVLSNIIQRGEITKPSLYLIEKIGKIEENRESLYLISTDSNVWGNRIKGDTVNVDYPAEDFYNFIIDEYFGEDSYIKNLILPEAEITDILKNGDAFLGQQVDFYFPEIKAVIEIDGSFHKKSFQNSKDILRDKALKKEGNSVFRINTYDIKNRTEVLNGVMLKLKELTLENDNVKKYLKDRKHDKDDIRIVYDSIMRFQILILECLKSGKLNIDSKVWDIDIVGCDINNVEEIFKIAFEDIIEWLKVIYKLMKIKLSIPSIVFGSQSKEKVEIDFCIYKRYSDEHLENSSRIFIRNDYFSEENYFELSFADSLKYEIHIEDKNNDFQELRFLLKNIFGFDDFRNGQIPIIKNILERNDTIGILPTGSGKSLCYQFASILQPGVTLIVVPIISLMIDQKKGMDKLFLNRTNLISSHMDGLEKENVLSGLKKGNYQFLWISPERFQNENFRDKIFEINKSMRFSTIVIDEVHCLSEWGHDFRVSYLTLIRTIKKYCSDVCLLGLTATASQAVLEDLKNEFENDGSGIKALTSMNRDELVFKRIIAENNKNNKLKEIFKELSTIFGENISIDKGDSTRCGLVFSSTVRGKKDGCENVCYEINNIEGFKDRVKTYHGQLDTKKRLEVQESFMDNKFPIITCTKAFGMGIDKSNIKYTIHYGLPQSIESFYQEAGRAGRDENKTEESYCYILYTPENKSDEQKYNYNINKIFSAETSAEERKEICGKFLKNDLSTIMFLWNQNKKNVSNEYEDIRNVLVNLYKGDFCLTFESSKELNEKQNALYKLSILGIVESWTIDYKSIENGEINVVYNTCEEIDISNHLMNYIHKYDIEFSLDGKNPRYEKYFNISKSTDKRITQLIKILIEWGNANILHQRLQSTYNMMELCDKKVSDEEFRRRIDYYFRYTENTVLFEHIVYNPIDFKYWFNILYENDEDEKVISLEKAKNLLASLQRFLESYRYNTGLNFLSGILRLYCDEFKNSEGVEKLKDSLQSIKELNEKEQEEIFSKVISFAKNLDENNKDYLSEMLIEYYPDKLNSIFESIQSRYVLSLLIENPVKKIEEIIKEKIKWTI